MLKEALETYGDFAKVRYGIQNILLILKGARLCAPIHLLNERPHFGNF